MSAPLLALCLLAVPALTLAQEGPAAPAAPSASQPSAPLPADAGTPPTVDPPVTTPPLPVAAPASGGPTPSTPALAPTGHQHLGLFVHADTGVGYLRTTGTTSASTFSGEGAALGFAVAVGWAPGEEWALAVELFSWKALSPSGLGSNTSVELQALGLNLTRYLVPAEVFASVVVSGTRLAITDSQESEYGSSDIGFGFKVLVGKEWRLNDWLGIGCAGELFFSVNREGGSSLRTLGGGLVFSLSAR